MQHLVSIIMPAYNADKYIAQSIQSVLEQTYQNWELIIVDDGSTDRTAQIVQDFLSLDDRIKYVFQLNKGLGSARNKGINNSTGELIAFLDSDDLWIKEKLELQVRRMEETKADLVFSDGFIFPEHDGTDETVSFQTIIGKFAGADMFSLSFVRNRIPVLSVLTRRETLNQVGLFDEDRRCHGAEDYDLWLRMAKHGAVFYGMKEKLVRYRIHTEAMSRNEVEMLKAWNTVLSRHKRDGSLSKKVKQDRYRELNQQLAAIFIDKGRSIDAVRYLKELPTQNKLDFMKPLLAAQASAYTTWTKALLNRCYCSGVYRTKCALKMVGINLGGMR